MTPAPRRRHARQRQVFAGLLLVFAILLLRETVGRSVVERSRRIAIGDLQEVVLRRMGTPSFKKANLISYRRWPSTYYRFTDWLFSVTGQQLPIADFAVVIEFDSYGRVGRIQRPGDATLDLRDTARIPGVIDR